MQKQKQSRKQETYNLYKFGRYGYYHITSEKYNGLKEAIKGFNKTYDCLKKKNRLFYSYKVTGL